MNFIKYAFLAFTISLSANQCIPIEKDLDSYTRPSTILLMTELDVGTINSIRKHKNDVFVLWNPSQDLSEFNLPVNLIVLSKKCTHLELQTLTECEHFDFAIISNHLLPISDSYIAILKKLAQKTFLHVPYSKRVKNLLRKYGFNGTFSVGNTTFKIAKESKGYLLRTSWFQMPSESNDCRTIVCTPNAKTLHKNYGDHPTQSNWVPGINLLTFKMLDGIYPSANTLVTSANRLYNVKHNDWMPNNMVVQGNHIALIDYIDPHGDTLRTVKSETLLNLVVQLINSTDSNQIPYYQDLILEYNRKILHPEEDY